MFKSNICIINSLRWVQCLRLFWMSMPFKANSEILVFWFYRLHDCLYMLRLLTSTSFERIKDANVKYMTNLERITSRQMFICKYMYFKNKLTDISFSSAFLVTSFIYYQWFIQVCFFKLALLKQSSKHPGDPVCNNLTTIKYQILNDLY